MAITLARDGMAFRRHAQQHLEKLHRGGAVGIVARILELRQLRGSRASPRWTAATISAPQCERSKPSAASADSRAAPGWPELGGDIADGVVFQHAAARHVAGLRLLFAPGRDFHQHGELLRLAHPRLQPLPGTFGVKVVGFGEVRTSISSLTQSLRPRFLRSASRAVNTSRRWVTSDTA